MGGIYTVSCMVSLEYLEVEPQDVELMIVIVCDMSLILFVKKYFKMNSNHQQKLRTGGI